jgi:hypothetical protein
MLRHIAPLQADQFMHDIVCYACTRMPLQRMHGCTLRESVNQLPNAVYQHCLATGPSKEIVDPHQESRAATDLIGYRNNTWSRCIAGSIHKTSPTMSFFSAT